MQRFYYSNNVNNFLAEEENFILGKLASNNQFALEGSQRDAWLSQIRILKQKLVQLQSGQILFEYTIPRMGKRIDNVLLYGGIIFLLEFKVGNTEYHKHALNQVIDYALDLQNFHKESHHKTIAPILIATNASEVIYEPTLLKDNILAVARCNKNNFVDVIKKVAEYYLSADIDTERWITSLYSPTPTIIEAAQALYLNHEVTNISRNDASATNLTRTTEAISQIVDESKSRNQKAICFITGVPGAGKTLAGLNLAIERQQADINEHAVFLSGNAPLVDVLQEALARDKSHRDGTSKSVALSETKKFIQIIHHFRDEAIETDKPLIEKVAIFDEAQRAWDEPHLTKFMNQKKGKPDFGVSEPAFLISIMDRHQDWAVIVCLIGGGQEINTGEAGISEWFNTLKTQYKDWNVYVSDKITDNEYTNGVTMSELFAGMNYQLVSDLHLAVSLRSFRSENVAKFIKALLDKDMEAARELYQSLKYTYPLKVTRDIRKAKAWVKSQACGTERYGIVATSGAKRLRPHGIWIQSKIDAPVWFLNDDDDVRSSYCLEETATEFDIQGLELDWTVVCWDADLRFNGLNFDFYAFKGTKWTTLRKVETQRYLKNAYRVLMTRARQGMVIFIPEGDDNDPTRQTSYYNHTYVYLKAIGIEEI